METKYYIPDRFYAQFEQELIAASRTVSIRIYDENGSKDIPRPATEEEQKVLQNTLLGGLSMINFGTHTYGEVCDIANTCEFIFMRFFPGDPDNHINTYDTIYGPLVRIWNKVSRSENDIK